MSCCARIWWAVTSINKYDRAATSGGWGTWAWANKLIAATRERISFFIVEKCMSHRTEKEKLLRK
jgi:hypothetical protein